MKYQSKFLLGITIIILVGSISCSKPKIENACESISIDDTVDSIQVLIPNVFTPNGDGINDRFCLVFKSKKEPVIDPYGGYVIDPNYPTIISMKITKWNSGAVVHERSNISFVDCYDEAWDGTDNGEICSGYYKYSIEIQTMEGTLKTYNGEICSLTDRQKQYTNVDQCVFQDELLSGSGSSTDPIK